MIMFLKNRIITFVLIAIMAIGSIGAFPLFVFSAFNTEINYQGKLMDSSGTSVTDGDYHMKFRLYMVETGGAQIWEGDRSLVAGNRIAVSNGLFSVMLGSSTALTSIDFNQTLWLEVEVGGTTGSTFEILSPRKKIGAVPAAFEADKLDGIDSISFLRSDANDTFDSGNTLTLAGALDSNGAVSFADTTLLFDGASTDFGVTGNLTFNANQLTLLKSSGNIGIGTTSPYAKLSVVGEVVGAYFTATTTATSTFAGGLAIGANALNVLQNGNVGIGTASPAYKLDVSGDVNITGAAYLGDTSTFFDTNGNLTFPEVDYIQFDSSDTRIYANTNTVEDLVLEADNDINLLPDRNIYTEGQSRQLQLQALVSGNNSWEAFIINSIRSRGTIASKSAIQDGDTIFGFNGVGYYNSTNLGAGAAFSFEADGNWSSGNRPARIVFSTHPANGDNNPSERMRINSAGNIGIGTTSPYAKLSVVGEVVGAYFTATTTATSTFAGGLDVLAINQTGSATSTFANGIQLSAGCFRDSGGSCITSGGGSSLWTDGGATSYLTAVGDSAGIGTTTAYAKLTIWGAGTGTGTAFEISDNASTTRFKVLDNGNTTLGTVVAGTWNGTAIGEIYGGTNQTTYTTGDILYASGSNTLSKLAVGSNGQVLKLASGIPSWGTDSTGSGGSGFWATTTDDLVVYPSDTTDVVVIGNNATTTTGYILEVVGSSLFDAGTLTIDATNDRVGISTTSPVSTLSVSGITTLDSTLITFASTTASILTVDYASTATSTIVDSQAYAWAIATSTTATPIFRIDTSGSTGASGVATSTFTGSFGINSGAFLYDSGANKTSIERLDLGAISFGDNAGKISWIDLPVTSGAVSGDVQAYSAQIDTNEILTIYSQADGSGGVTDVRVVIGTSTDTVLGSSNIPYGSLIVADGILCVDDGGAANCDDAQRFAGGLYATSTTVTAIDVAENYPTKDESLEAGDIVMLNFDNPIFVSKYEIATTTEFKPVLLGAISTSPGLLLGGFANNMFIDEIKAPVVLSGRIPVKVNTENGDISIGDRITPSSISGVGMKANSTDDTIGIALQSYNSPDETGSIIVFIDLDDRDNEGLFSSILGWFENIGVKILNGIVSAKEFIADKVTTNELCIGSTCVNEAQLQKLIENANNTGAGNGENSNTIIIENIDESNTDTIAPTITLKGNNPAKISVGVKYSDFGAIITDNINSNLGYKVSVNGGAEIDISKLAIDTSIDDTYTIVFNATDQAGNIATATRIVIVGSGDVAPFETEDETSPEDEQVQTLEDTESSEGGINESEVIEVPVETTEAEKTSTENILDESIVTDTDTTDVPTDQTEAPIEIVNEEELLTSKDI